MKQLLRIVQELQSHSGKNDKKRIIKENLNNKMFVDMMQFLLNDFVLTGISKKKVSKKVPVPSHAIELPYNMEGMFNYLSKHNTGTDVDIYAVQQYISEWNDDEVEEMLRQLITKDLKLGVSAKSWNEVAPKELHIPVFDVMLAKKYEDHEKKVKGDFVLTKKLDGTRIIVIKQNGKVKSYTRKGKEYIGLQQIESDIMKIPYDVVLDGELLADTEGDTNEVFAETLKKSRNKDENKTGLIFHVFDMLTPEEFKSGESEDNCVYRKQALSTLFEQHDFEYVQEVKPLYIGSDIEQISVWSNWADDNGYEGIMINLDKPYVCKRTDSLLKVKGMQSCDLRVVGFEEGEGRNSGKLGAIICEYKGNTVKVGSGWSDSLREEVWNNQDDWINTIIEVQYFEESKDSKTGLVSLRFPVFKCRRDDKDEPSYN